MYVCVDVRVDVLCLLQLLAHAATESDKHVLKHVSYSSSSPCPVGVEILVGIDACVGTRVDACVGTCVDACVNVCVGLELQVTPPGLGVY